MKILTLVIAAVFSLGSIHACSSQQLSIRSIYSSNFCTPLEARVESITSQQQLEDLIRSKPNQLLQKPVAVPQVDFQQQSVILVALGQKNSLGYSIRINDQQAVLDKGKLRLPLSLIQPDLDAFHAQVITRPCRIVALPKANFSEIVLDQP